MNEHRGKVICGKCGETFFALTNHECESPASPGCSSADFLELVIEFGNASFNCGEWDGENSDEYEEILNKSRAAKAKVIAAFESR